MAETKSGAGRWNGTTPGDRLAAQLDNPEVSANRPARQVRAPKMSILSADPPAGCTATADRVQIFRTRSEILGSGRAAPSPAEAALGAVLSSRTLPEAHGAARDGLDAIAAAAPSDLLEVDEAAELSGRTPSTVRRWAAAHRLGRRLGGRWLLSRARFAAFVDGGAA